MSRAFEIRPSFDGMASGGDLVRINGTVTDGLKTTIGRTATMRMSAAEARDLALTLLNLADSADELAAEQRGAPRSYAQRPRWQFVGSRTIAKATS